MTHESVRKPTIEELETILRGESPLDITMAPDGSISAHSEAKIPWPDPTPEMLEDPAFNAIWNVIKTWDIHVPGAYVGYCGATGNHVRAILDVLLK